MELYDQSARRYAHVMHWANVPYVPLDTCREVFRPVVEVKIIPGMLCGGEFIYKQKYPYDVTFSLCL